MTDLEEAREFFGGDLYATETTGIIIEEVGEHYARCSMEITPLPLRQISDNHRLSLSPAR